MGAVAKHIFLVTDPTKLESTIRTAFEIARTGRPGPVVIDIPKDVQNWVGPFHGRGRLPVRGYRERMHAVISSKLTADKRKQFFDALAQAERPLIYAGGGAINGGASEQLRKFADEYKIPVVTTLMGIGTYDTTKPRALHMLGMHGTAFANYATDDSDFLIAIGARFDDRVAAVPDKFAPNAKYIAHFDIDPSEIDKVKSVNWHHIGLLPESLQRLLDYGKEVYKFEADYSEWHRHITDLKSTYAMNYDKETDAIQPYAVIEEINKHTKGNAIISTGVGQHQMWAAQYFDFKQPRLWLTSGSMGTMGFGLPAAIGAQFAKPDSMVINIDGDASIRMNLGELETVTTYELPVKTVVLNNFGDGMVRQWQKLFFKGRMSASDKSLHKKNFIKSAESDGFEYAVRLDNKADLPRVIKEFVEYPGPAFLEVIIDRDAGVYPMVGPGMCYEEMITGDYIPTRDAGSAKKEVDSSEMF
jgi:acetolactate synthase-1/2/3 large subunit